ncbi:MAG: 2-phosphosulfolactate phosphatase [Deltaproteobacteria bacterium]|nr:2-phosphosulfolactate phosphatase [Deltaproteobacteria bacterium]
MPRTVIIDCFPESAERYRSGYAVVAIDVIRASTTIATALSLGRRVFPVKTTDEAFILADKLHEPLLVGEIGGNVPYGFEMTNSPADIAERADIARPMIFISSSGTQLMLNAAGSEAVYAGCFRNFSAVAERVALRHETVAVIGAGTRGQFRREDQMGCALVAERLVELGYTPGSRQTEEAILRWKGRDFSLIRSGKSAEYLKRTGQERDLEFVLSHIDDLQTTPQLIKNEFIGAV